MSRTIISFIFLLCGLAAFFQGPANAEDFYEFSPKDLSGPPGTLIRAAPMEIPSVYRANAYRILYVSQNTRGEKIAVSGMALVSTFPHPGGARPVVAWAHATTGVAHKCAPSLQTDPLYIPGVKDMIVKGYTVVATDYPGLGTPGAVPYLIGVGEAQAVLDSVKAIRELPEAQAGRRYVLWGHSQGGHAALFAASLARSYAREIELLGVAAAAPATNLNALLTADIDSIAGRVLTAMTLLSWSRTFNFPLDGLVNEQTRRIIDHVDKNCVDDLSGKLGALSAEQDLSAHFLEYPPDSREPWRSLLADNNPAASPIGVPAFIAQGRDDVLVRPETTTSFVRTLCRSDKSVFYLMMPKVDHGMAADKSAGEAVNWMGGRFRGDRPPGNCGE